MFLKRRASTRSPVRAATRDPDFQVFLWTRPLLYSAVWRLPRARFRAPDTVCSPAHHRTHTCRDRMSDDDRGTAAGGRGGGGGGGRRVGDGDDDGLLRRKRCRDAFTPGGDGVGSSCGGGSGNGGRDAARRVDGRRQLCRARRARHCSSLNSASEDADAASGDGDGVGGGRKPR